MSAPEPQAPERASRIVGTMIADRYQVLSLLGEGGMGAVYLVEHILMRKRLALKVLHEKMEANPEVVARFEREAMAAAHIEHPNVAAATDFGRTADGAFFLVLEYIEGKSLAVALREGAFSVERSVAIARQIASAMVRAHDLGIVHRDLKPENVMLVQRGGESDIVKVLDFGIAKIDEGLLASHGRPSSGPALTRAGAIYGTPEYMAPEQALGEVVDARSDLYSLGAILYEMLTGARPFAEHELTLLLGKVVTQPVPPIRERAPDRSVPPALDAVVMRLLAKQAANRYAGARELLAALDDACGAATFATRPTVPAGGIITPTGVAASPATPMPSRNVGARAPTIPRAVLFGIAASALALVLGLVIVAVARGRRAGAATAAMVGGIIEAATTSLSDETIAASAREGSAALEKLASEHPNDARVARAQVAGHVAARRTPDAMRSVARLLSLERSAATEREIEQLVVNAAISPSEGADAAFALLEGPFGERGSDILYDLMQRQEKPVRTRAAQSLAKPDVRAHTTPATLVAFDLKNAAGCEAKRAVVARVRDAGDARALPLLRQLTATTGCGFLRLADCYRCLRSDTALRDAIGALEGRARQTAP